MPRNVWEFLQSIFCSHCPFCAFVHSCTRAHSLRMSLVFISERNFCFLDIGGGGFCLRFVCWLAFYSFPLSPSLQISCFRCIFKLLLLLSLLYHSSSSSFRLYLLSLYIYNLFTILSLCISPLMSFCLSILSHSSVSPLLPTIIFSTLFHFLPKWKIIHLGIFRNKCSTKAPTCVCSSNSIIFYF